MAFFGGGRESSISIGGGFYPGGLTSGGVGGGAPSGKLNFLQNGGTAGTGQDTAPALATLCAAVGATVSTIYLPAGVYLIGSNVVVPVNVTLELAAGASFTLAAGVTMTINGPVAFPFTQIFTGTGVAVFARSQNSRIPPQWWGALGNNVHDDTAAFQAAFAAKNGMMFLPAGNYRISGFDTGGNEITMRGEGRDVTFIGGDNDLILNVGTAQGRVRFQDLSFDQTGFVLGKHIVGAIAGSVARAAFANCDFYAGNYHIVCNGANTCYVDWTARDCRFRAATIVSRYFNYVNVLREMGCYTSGNAEGLRVLRGNKIDIDGTFEYNTGFGINLPCIDVGIGLRNVTIDAYFERNGVLNPDTSTSGPDINLSAAAGVNVRNIRVKNSRFSSAVAGLLTRTPLNMQIAGPGSIARVQFSNCYADGTQLASNGYGVVVEQVEMAVGIYPTDADILDHQAGTYVPVLTTGTGTVTLDPAYNTLQYSKIGKVVHVQGSLRLSAIAAPTGTLHISLPYAPGVGVQHSTTLSASIAVDKMANTWTGAPEAILLPGAQYISLYELVAGALSAPAAKLAVICDMYVSCTYEAAN